MKGHVQFQIAKQQKVTFDNMLMEEETLEVGIPIPLRTSKVPQMCVEITHDNGRAQLLGLAHQLFQFS